MKLRNGGYANVASTLALVVALGGTSYAAVAIPKNSVGSKQITNSSIKSADVKNGGLTAVDFKAGQLPAGPAGPAGQRGATGSQGPVGPVGPSHGYQAFPGFLPSPWSGSEQVMTSFDLPAGSYVLNGKVMANNNSDVNPADVSCHLRAGGASVDSTGVITLPPGTQSDRAFVPVFGATTLAAPATVTLSCTASTTTGSWSDRALTAVKVGAIG